MKTETEYPQNLQAAYRALISAYMKLLRSVSKDHGNEVITQIIEDHVRTVLLDVLKALTFHQAHLFGNAIDEELAWINKEVDYLPKLIDQLVDFKQRLFSFAKNGVVLIFTSAILQFAGPSSQPGNLNYILDNFLEIFQTLLLTFGGLLLVVGLISVGFGHWFMTVKRQYLKPGYDVSDNKLEEAQPTDSINIYILENDLYSLLERKKPLEIPWDVLGYIMYSLIGFPAAWYSCCGTRLHKIPVFNG